MAPPQRYNPPPNWPPPPPGWTPPPGWSPDPAWGPPPAGWQLWVTGRPNSNPFGLAFLAAGVLWLIQVGLILVLSGGRGDIAYVIGYSVMSPVIAAVITALIARGRPTKWSIWMYFLCAFLIGVALRLINGVGQLGS